MSDYITTYSGVHFYPTDPDPDGIRIGDIAHSLSLICRGNGHVKRFFSVGEHCLLCSAEAEARGYSRRLQLACLLHDASEAYMSDVPRPFKKSLQDYIRKEKVLLGMIYRKYLGSDLSETEEELLGRIDDDLLAYDLVYLLGEGEEKELPKLAVTVSYEFESFAAVEEKYLRRFDSLTH